MDAIDLVGPHGYVHGWIKVGADGKVPGVPKGASPKGGTAGSTLDAFKSWRDGLTPAEDKAMRFYQSPGFAIMNGQLRGLDAEKLKAAEHASDADLARARQASKNLTKAIAKAPPLPRDTTVYRGFDAGQFGELAPGKVVTDKGFTSTSVTDDAGAVGRAGSKGQATITLPAGTRAAAGSARELVLPPGASFRVVSVARRGGVTHVQLELVPKGAKLASQDGALDLSALTPAYASTPSPLGRPGGPGLWRTKGLKLPDYIENIARGIMAGGEADRSRAIATAIAAVKRWAAGGGKVTPEVRAAAAAALAEWSALKASHAHANGGGMAIDLGGYLPPHVPSGSPDGGQFGTTSGGGAAAPAPAAVKAPAKPKPKPAVKPPATTPGTVAAQARKASLHAQATRLRTQASAIDKQVAGINSVIAAQVKATAAAQKKAGPSATAKAKAAIAKAAPKKAATTTAAKKKPTLAQNRSAVKTLTAKARTLRSQAGALDAQASAIKLTSGGGMASLDLAVADAIAVPGPEVRRLVAPPAERVPQGVREGGQYAPRPAQFTRHDTPGQAAAVINGMGPQQRAAVRASTLPPPGYSWGPGDRLAEAR